MIIISCDDMVACVVNNSCNVQICNFIMIYHKVLHSKKIIFNNLLSLLTCAKTVSQYCLYLYVQYYLYYILCKHEAGNVLYPT